MNPKKVAVVGGTGYLGNKIVKALMDLGAEVTAIVRTTSNRSRLEQMGVKNFVIGDMMDRASLRLALSPIHGFDAIVSSAAGYTRHTKGDNTDTDTTGYRNLVDAGREAGIPRFVLISILECDKASEVPHFHNKYLIEKYLSEKQQPFIALRPGAFFDWPGNYMVNKINKGIVPVFFFGVDYGVILTADLAHYAALSATTLPDSELNTTVDVGWNEPVNDRKLAEAFGKVLNRPMRSSPVFPAIVSKVIAPAMAAFSSNMRDMLSMSKWVSTGVYVSRDTERQKKLFGDLPTVEEGVRRFCMEKGLIKSQKFESAWSS